MGEAWLLCAGLWNLSSAHLWLAVAVVWDVAPRLWFVVADYSKAFSEARSGFPIAAQGKLPTLPDRLGSGPDSMVALGRYRKNSWLILRGTSGWASG